MNSRYFEKHEREKSQIDSIKDFILKIKDEIAFSEKKYIQSNELISETINLLADFFKNIVHNGTFGNDSYSGRDNKRDISAAKTTVFCTLENLKIFLSEYQFTSF